MTQWPYDVDPIWGCWIWRGPVDKRDGYPLLWRGKHPIKAYRAVYGALVGEIPDGMVADHRCRVRRCVRPEHLLITTQSNNLMRKSWAVRVRQPLCDKGHDNTHQMLTVTGGRLCRTCHR